MVEVPGSIPGSAHTYFFQLNLSQIILINYIGGSSPASLGAGGGGPGGGGAGGFGAAGGGAGGFGGAGGGGAGGGGAGGFGAGAVGVLGVGGRAPPCITRRCMIYNTSTNIVSLFVRKTQ